jgi:hypothetical protein
LLHRTYVAVMRMRQEMGMPQLSEKSALRKRPFCAYSYRFRCPTPILAHTARKLPCGRRRGWGSYQAGTTSEHGQRPPAR